MMLLLRICIISVKKRQKWKYTFIPYICMYFTCIFFNRLDESQTIKSVNFTIFWDNKRNKSHELLKAGYNVISIRNYLRNIIMLNTFTDYIWLSYG